MPVTGMQAYLDFFLTMEKRRSICAFFTLIFCIWKRKSGTPKTIFRNGLSIRKLDFMDKLKKFELMEKISRELEDLKNSQQAIIQKIGKIEVDNIELGDSRLEKETGDMHQRVSENLDSIQGLFDYFAGKTEDFGDKNNIDQLREEAALRDTENG